MPIFRFCTPNPFRFFVPKCRNSRSVACLFGENPVFEFEGEVPVSEMFFEYFPFAAFEKNFFGLEVTQQFIDVIVVAFGREEFSRRNIEECDSACSVFTEMHAGQKSCFLCGRGYYRRWKRRA